MCKTKAWWYILANTRRARGSGFRLSECRHHPQPELSAGEYVSKYMYDPDASHAFSLD